jgi:ABC-type lipoprotein release transport system permease subunit
VAASLALNRYLALLLFGVKSGDPLTHALVLVGLVLAVGAASLTPARRPAVVDPAVVLREE